MNVLLLEDDALLQRTTTRMLRRAYENVTVTAVDSVPKAIAMLQHFAYDLVIADFQVLHGTGGDVLSWVRDEKPGLVDRFVFFSGSLEARALHDKFIEKGCMPDEFIEQLHKLVGASA